MPQNVQETILKKRTAVGTIFMVIVLAVWIAWTVTPLLITALSCVKITREAFATPEYGDWKGVLDIFRFSRPSSISKRSSKWKASAPTYGTGSWPRSAPRRSR